MEYKLYKASLNKNATACTLWFENPVCVFEKPHKVVFFSPHPVIDILQDVWYKYSDHSAIDRNDIPVNLLPEELQTLHGEVREVRIGLHKHVSMKACGGRPLMTRSLVVFAPMTYVQRHCDGKMEYQFIESPEQIVQNIVNKEWIPVDED